MPFGGLMTAILSAVLAALITHLLALRREQRKEEAEERKSKELEQREKVGLLKLVHSEVTNNLEHLKEMGNDPDKDSEMAAALRSEAWEQSRNKLAELMEDEQHFEYLVSAYGALYVLKDRLSPVHPDYSPDPSGREKYAALVKSVSRHHWLAFDACQKETGRFRAWNKGMLVSKPISELDQSEDVDDVQQPSLPRPEG